MNVALPVRVASALLLLGGSAAAQTIDFERLPDGTRTTDQQAICAQYAPLGATFTLLSRTTGEPVGCPLIAKVGGPETAFAGCVASDTPDLGQGLGTRMLTDDAAVTGIPADLLVTYSHPVSGCSGVILDVDCRNMGGPPCEQWTITALDSTGATLATRVIDALQGANDPNCVFPESGPGDGKAFGWSIDLPAAKIHSVLIRYTGAAPDVGLAFDNFTTSDAAGLPQVEVKGPRAEICAGHTVELFADTRRGIPPYTHQWQEELAPDVWQDLGTAPSQLVTPLATTTYRAVVTDSVAATGSATVEVTVVSGPGHAVCDERLLVSSFNTDRVLRYDPVTKSFDGTFVAAGSGGLDGPSGLDFGRDGSLYVASQATNSVLRYNGSTGAFIDAFVSGGLNVPGELTFGPDGDLYVASFSGNQVLRYDGVSGAALGTFATGVGGPTGLIFRSSDLNLYVSSRTNNSIRRFNGTTGASLGDFVASTSGALSLPRGLAFFGVDDDLYVGAETNDVKRYDGVSAEPEGPFVRSGSGTLSRSNDVAFGLEGNLYVASFNNDKILIYGEQTGAFIDAMPTGNGLDAPAWLRFTFFCGDGRCDTEAGERACNCVEDCGAPPGTELSCDDGIDDDCDRAADCADADCAADPVCGGAGATPDGAAAGPQLLLGRNGLDRLDLSWGVSCRTSDDDYEVYEGLLGSWSGHVPVTCSTGGVPAWTLTPAGGDRYYLVVPRNGTYEGSYGEATATGERAQGAFACRTRLVAGCF